MTKRKLSRNWHQLVFHTIVGLLLSANAKAADPTIGMTCLSIRLNDLSPRDQNVIIGSGILQSMPKETSTSKDGESLFGIRSTKTTIGLIKSTKILLIEANDKAEMGISIYRIFSKLTTANEGKQPFVHACHLSKKDNTYLAIFANHQLSPEEIHDAGFELIRFDTILGGLVKFESTSEGLKAAITTIDKAAKQGQDKTFKISGLNVKEGCETGFPWFMRRGKDQTFTVLPILQDGKIKNMVVSARSDLILNTFDPISKFPKGASVLFYLPFGLQMSKLVAPNSVSLVYSASNPNDTCISSSIGVQSPSMGK